MLPQFNTAAMEDMCSATYLEVFVNCLEHIPNELSPIISHLRELDSNIHGLVVEMKVHNATYHDKTADVIRRQKALLAVQKILIKAQQLWDEKIGLAAVVIDIIDTRHRHLLMNQENIDPTVVDTKEKEEKPRVKDTKSTKQPEKVFPVVPKTSPTPPRTQDVVATPSVSTPSHPTPKASGSSPVTAGTSASPSSATDTKAETSSQPNKLKRQRRQRMQDAVKEEEKKEEEAQQPKKKKKRKAKSANKNFEKTLVGEPIDPDEPTYCLCGMVSYGDMIGCDNDSCAMEWFHFNCVQLQTKPKGKWYCPKCRGDRPNVKRSDLK